MEKIFSRLDLRFFEHCTFLNYISLDIENHIIKLKVYRDKPPEQTAIDGMLNFICIVIGSVVKEQVKVARVTKA